MNVNVSRLGTDGEKIFYYVKNNNSKDIVRPFENLHSNNLITIIIIMEIAE